MIGIERAKVEDLELIKRLLSETWIDTYAGHLSRSMMSRSRRTSTEQIGPTGLN